MCIDFSCECDPSAPTPREAISRPCERFCVSLVKLPFHIPSRLFPALLRGLAVSCKRIEKQKMPRSDRKGRNGAFFIYPLCSCQGQRGGASPLHGGRIRPEVEACLRFLQGSLHDGSQDLVLAGQTVQLNAVFLRLLFQLGNGQLEQLDCEVSGGYRHISLHLFGRLDHACFAVRLVFVGILPHPSASIRKSSGRCSEGARG